MRLGAADAPARLYWVDWCRTQSVWNVLLGHIWWLVVDRTEYRDTAVPWAKMNEWWYGQLIDENTERLVFRDLVASGLSAENITAAFPSYQQYRRMYVDYTGASEAEAANRELHNMLEYCVQQGLLHTIPLFFLLSGYVAAHAAAVRVRGAGDYFSNESSGPAEEGTRPLKERLMGNFVVRRLSRLVLPFLFGTVCAVLPTKMHFNDGEAWSVLDLLVSDLWFLWVLFLFALAHWAQTEYLQALRRWLCWIELRKDARPAASNASGLTLLVEGDALPSWCPDDASSPSSDAPVADTHSYYVEAKPPSGADLTAPAARLEISSPDGTHSACYEVCGAAGGRLVALIPPAPAPPLYFEVVPDAAIEDTLATLRRRVLLFWVGGLLTNVLLPVVGGVLTNTLSGAGMPGTPVVHILCPILTYLVSTALQLSAAFYAQGHADSARGGVGPPGVWKETPTDGGGEAVALPCRVLPRSTTRPPGMYCLRVHGAMFFSTLPTYFIASLALIAPPALHDDDEWEWLSVNLWYPFLLFYLLYVLGYTWQLFYSAGADGAGPATSHPRRYIAYFLHTFLPAKGVLPGHAVGIVLLLLSAFWPVITFSGARSLRRIGPWELPFDATQRVLTFVRCWAWMGVMVAFAVKYCDGAGWRWLHRHVVQSTLILYLFHRLFLSIFLEALQGEAAADACDDGPCLSRFAVFGWCTVLTFTSCWVLYAVLNTNPVTRALFGIDSVRSDATLPRRATAPAASPSPPSDPETGS
eukprot:TRINITY_DN14981_c0_g2_i1.p1 TRINITY_DN14981_c0_g2~~TRINITY_DN14981_c0_g2_i1.p1  ORF type:complete len:754 (+),score=157.20 TRINITY_DN14981_c0_g2_i1:121-2382(+)